MDKYHIFHQLHQQQTGFVLPNAWDLSSAQFIQASGAKALATTSWGIAASYGLQDGERFHLVTYYRWSKHSSITSLSLYL